MTLEKLTLQKLLQPKKRKEHPTEPQQKNKKNKKKLLQSKHS